jgi:hypothetical protein
MSDLQIESALLKLFILLRVKAEQLRRAVASRHLSFFERNEQAEAQYLFAKVALVQLGFENCFIQML